LVLAKVGHCPPPPPLMVDHHGLLYLECIPVLV
jgi:hypothetical protein